jgi:CTP:molybdopterin cytidylyltransferase MocA
VAEDADFPESRATVYTTLAAGPEFRHEIEVKRSRFITVLHRTGDEEGARAVLAAHPDWLFEVPIAGAPPRDIDDDRDYRQALEAAGRA